MPAEEQWGRVGSLALCAARIARGATGAISGWARVSHKERRSERVHLREGRGVSD
jgi:hypothetical protein